nr:UDP-3-O-(3-hydroxymyristoyl)glucosamine N-acyltransferase [uncultured Holophaga sp.]
MFQTEITAAELGERLGGVLRNCPPGTVLTGVKPLDEADGASVSFLANPKYAQKAQSSEAGLIIVDPGTDLGERPQLAMENPYWGFAQAVGILHPEPEPEWSDTPVHSTAVLGEGCRIGVGSTVGARSVLGRNCRLHPGVHIAEDCTLGDDCELFPGVTLYRRTLLGHRVRIHANSVLGSDGYGYVLVKGRHEKVPQAGHVEVGDNVEIGACVTVDRGALGPTRIQSGTKVDNLCQIAHNVQIGKHCLIVSQAGISGSSSLGDYVTLAGKAGVIGHLKIGSRSVVAGNTMVGKDLPEGSFVSGYMARPHRQWLECQAALNRLPGILRRLSQREK